MIPVLKPSYGTEEAEAVAEVLRSGWTGLGPKTQEFETAFSKFIGEDVFTVGMNSCTSALHAALLIHEVGPGDEVLVPALNFVSGAHVISQCGAKPVWIDVLKDTLCADPTDIAKKITKKTKAIVVMHYGGHPCAMDNIKFVAGDIPIIEDAAHACGAYYRNVRIGSLGNTTCFSFHAVKNLSMGEGGAVVTHNKELRDRLLKLRWLGINKSTSDRSTAKSYNWDYSVEQLGFKYHLSDIAAAIGLVQLRNLDIANSRRRQIAKMYNNGFRDFWPVTTPTVDASVITAQHLYVIQVRAKKRAALMDSLTEYGVGYSVHYKPVFEHPVYTSEDHKCPVTAEVAMQILSLPMHLNIDNCDVEHIIDAVKGGLSL